MEWKPVGKEPIPVNRNIIIRTDYYNYINQTISYTYRLVVFKQPSLTEPKKYCKDYYEIKDVGGYSSWQDMPEYFEWLDLPNQSMADELYLENLKKRSKSPHELVDMQIQSLEKNNVDRT